jgi:hypothetical protein
LRFSCFFLRSGLADHYRRRPKRIRRVRGAVVHGLLEQAAQLLVYLLPVVPQYLDAVRTLLGIEVELPEYGPAA